MLRYKAFARSDSDIGNRLLVRLAKVKSSVSIHPLLSYLVSVLVLLRWIKVEHIDKYQLKDRARHMNFGFSYLVNEVSLS